jgi:serine carboxypeptidase-like clade 2
VDMSSTYTYLWSHGIISDVVYNDIIRVCDFEHFVLNTATNNVTKKCYKLLNLADNEVGDYINAYDVILDICYPALIQQELRLRKKVSN